MGGWRKPNLWLGGKLLHPKPATATTCSAVDGHGSHIDLSTLQLCKENNIILYQLRGHDLI